MSKGIISYSLLFILILNVGVNQGQFIPIFDWVRSFFGHYEQPPYTSVRNITTVSISHWLLFHGNREIFRCYFSQEVEERIYPSKYWACTEEYFSPTTKDKDTKKSEMFMSLFRYIQGKNDAGLFFKTNYYQSVSTYL